MCGTYVSHPEVNTKRSPHGGRFCLCIHALKRMKQLWPKLGMNTDSKTITLWRPIGPEELALIAQTDMRAFPPRLPEQPIFYPVLTESYAIKIARDWNVKASGSGYVTRFDVLKSFLDAYDVQVAGGRAHLEYWIPAEEMAAFNDAIVGQIVITQEFT